jgi:phosphoserine phosphatase
MAAFDMDGPLRDGSDSWSQIHQERGTQAGAIRNFHEYLRGKISYREWMLKDVKLWDRVHVSELEKVFDYRLTPNAERVVSELSKEYEIAIITAAPDFLANIIAERLGIEHVVSNGLELDDQGYLTGGVIHRFNLSEKDKALRKLCSDLKIAPNKVAALGDSKWDQSMLDAAGMSISYNCEELNADYYIKDMINVLDLL